MKNIKLKQKLNLHTVILADPKLCAGAKVVAGVLLFLFHNTKSGQCFPTNATVGAAVGMHKDTVSRHNTELVKAGYVFRDPRYNNSSITDFNWERGSDEAVAAVRERVKQSRQNRHEGVSAKSSVGHDDSVGRSRQNRHVHNDENVNLTSELNPKTENVNLSLSEREKGIGFEFGKEGIVDGTPVDGAPDIVPSGEELADTDINSKPDIRSHGTPDDIIPVADICPDPYSRDHDIARVTAPDDNDPLSAHDHITLHSAAALSAPTAVDGSHNSMVPHSVVPHSEFEYFWSVYPRREKKEDAHSQYVAAVEAGVSPSLLTDKAGRFARSVVGKDPKYIPYPATWLRDKRWTDDYAAASNNPYYEEDLQYPPPPPGMDPGVWRGIMRCRVAREQR